MISTNAPMDELIEFVKSNSTITGWKNDECSLNKHAHLVLPLTFKPLSKNPVVSRRKRMTMLGGTMLMSRAEEVNALSADMLEIIRIEKEKQLYVSAAYKLFMSRTQRVFAYGGRFKIESFERLTSSKEGKESK